MPARPIIPATMRPAVDVMRMSPGVLSRGHLFLAGMTGADADGQMPADAKAQFRNAFDKIALVLAEAGLTWADVVEMTSYHIGLRGHFDLFQSVRFDYVGDPYPAWTAIEAAGLRREGAIVEIRVIAGKPEV